MKAREDMAPCTVSITTWDDLITASAYCSGIKVARAYARVDMQSAKLVDIFVESSVPWRSNWFRNLIGRPITKSFRGRGIGTRLLANLLCDLASRGVRHVWGDAKGDIPRLKRWYERCGFAFDEGTHRISKSLP